MWQPHPKGWHPGWKKGKTREHTNIHLSWPPDLRYHVTCPSCFCCYVFPAMMLVCPQSERQNKPSFFLPEARDPLKPSTHAGNQTLQALDLFLLSHVCQLFCHNNEKSNKCKSVMAHIATSKRHKSVMAHIPTSNRHKSVMAHIPTSKNTVSHQLKNSSQETKMSPPY